jgi:SAM-dependent methyltransferase
MTCLDIGTMEGLVPALLARRGAKVTAVDFSDHCLGKLAAVKHYHGVDFEFRRVGLLYDLHRNLPGRSFDLINLSGLLYHVFDPLAVLAAVRPLVKRDGLVVVSTSVTHDDGDLMDFNAAGRLLAEGNTFWYPSVRLLDYLLRLLRLTPIDCEYLPHELMQGHPVVDKTTSYLSVVCRACGHSDEDDWMREVARSSWEWQGIDWARADAQPRSDVAYARDAGAIDLHAAVAAGPPVALPAATDDSHLLRLGAAS